ncbi:MAG: hypothetical protein KAT68_14725 [Bacteroidales bacterium]|nr:hypothetical protein [Bacteroidales bacterium]
MKTITFIVVILFMTIILKAQNREEYTINIKSKYETNIQINFAVKFMGNLKTLLSDSALHSFEKNISDSVAKFDVMQMYSSKRYDIDIMLNETLKQYSKSINVKIESSVLLDLIFPQEIKILNEEINKLEMRYLGVILKIEERKKLLRKKLSTEVKLTDEETKEIERELFVLENSKYIDRIYKEEIGTLLIK